MAVIICKVCGANVSGYEGERGTFHGVCKVCGKGYNKPDGEDTRPTPEELAEPFKAKAKTWPYYGCYKIRGASAHVRAYTGYNLFDARRAVIRAAEPGSFCWIERENKTLESWPDGREGDPVRIKYTVRKKGSKYATVYILLSDEDPKAALRGYEGYEYIAENEAGQKIAGGVL